jgi:hypothetical protein
MSGEACGAQRGELHAPVGKQGSDASGDLRNPKGPGVLPYFARCCLADARFLHGLWSKQVAQIRTGLLIGLTSMAMVVMVGSSSCSTSSRFGDISTFKVVTPVTLPPGRLRLVTRLQVPRLVSALLVVAQSVRFNSVTRNGSSVSMSSALCR